MCWWGGGVKTHEIPEDRTGGQLIYIPYVLGFSSDSNTYLPVQKLYILEYLGSYFV